MASAPEGAGVLDQVKGWLFVSAVSSEIKRDRGLRGLPAFICNDHEILYLALNFFQRSLAVKALQMESSNQKRLTSRVKR